MLLAPSTGLAISRDAVLARAQVRIDKPVPYSQSKYYAGYRTDCSGYVSMCWATGTSWSTSTFFAVTHKISLAQLKPGDAMLKKGYHIRLFYGWADDAHTSYITYESGYGQIAACRIHDLATDLAAGYVPTRYDRITDSATPNNVLRNRTFDSWVRSYSQAPEEPVWWSASDGTLGTTSATHRKDVYRTARNSLELGNPSEDSDQVAEVSQSATITAGVPYVLSVWARTPTDPSLLRLGVSYLDSDGNSIAETATAGDAWALNSTAFRRMSVKLTTPANAKRAVVSVRLGGGTTTDTAGNPAAGTSAILDDISLARPQAVVSIKASASRLRRGRSVSLSGSISPTSSIGVRATLYVQRPGSAWKRFSATTVRDSSGTAAWRTAYYFSKRMRRGTYRFRIVVPSFPGYLGATSSIVSVKLK
jgi:hypothetical protein